MSEESILDIIKNLSTDTNNQSQNNDGIPDIGWISVTEGMVPIIKGKLEHFENKPHVKKKEN